MLCYAPFRENVDAMKRSHKNFINLKNLNLQRHEVVLPFLMYVLLFNTKTVRPATINIKKDAPMLAPILLVRLFPELLFEPERKLTIVASSST